MRRYILIILISILLVSCSKTSQGALNLNDDSSKTYVILNENLMNEEKNNINKNKETLDNESEVLTNPDTDEKENISHNKLTTSENKHTTDTHISQIKIYRDSTKIKTETYTEEITYKTEQRYDASLHKGQTKIKQVGKNGQREVLIEVSYTNNKETSRKIISNTVIEEPINEIILVGTKEEESTPTHVCTNGKDKNKPCDDRIYNSDLDTAYRIIKGNELSLCQKEGQKIGGQTIDGKFVGRWSCHAILHNDTSLGQWGYALYLYDDNDDPIK